MDTPPHNDTRKRTAVLAVALSLVVGALFVAFGTVRVPTTDQPADQTSELILSLRALTEETVRILESYVVVSGSGLTLQHLREAGYTGPIVLSVGPDSWIALDRSSARSALTLLEERSAIHTQLDASEEWIIWSSHPITPPSISMQRKHVLSSSLKRPIGFLTSFIDESPTTGPLYSSQNVLSARLTPKKVAQGIPQSWIDSRGFQTVLPTTLMNTSHVGSENTAGVVAIGSAEDPSAFLWCTDNAPEAETGNRLLAWVARHSFATTSSVQQRDGTFRSQQGLSEEVSALLNTVTNTVRFSGNTLETFGYRDRTCVERRADTQSPLSHESEIVNDRDVVRQISLLHAPELLNETPWEISWIHRLTQNNLMYRVEQDKASEILHITLTSVK